MATFGASNLATATGSLASIGTEDCNVGNAGNDGISSIIWSPTANFLVSTNWDSGVRCWEVVPGPSGNLPVANPKAQVNHENQAPALSAAFSLDGTTVFSGGCDKAVRMWQLGGTSVAQQIGVHDAPVKSVAFLRPNLVVSGGWDKKLKFWDTRQPSPIGVLEMPERVYDMDVRNNLMVVATAGRHIIAYDVANEPREHSRRESPLKFQTRCISCFTDCNGFAVGSIEGRVGIHYLNKVPGKDSFAFKCHRQDNAVYSVNAICFNNNHGTFATVGSDGGVSFWDHGNKQRLKGFNNINRPIPCASFNATGNLFAYASSYDWSKGSSYYAPGTPNEIFIHLTPDEEIKPKSKKTGFKTR